MNKYTNTKSLNTRNIEGCYIPDDIEKIKDIIDGTDEENTSIADEEEQDYFDDNLFKLIDKMVHNHKAKVTSLNYAKAANYLSKLRKTKIVETADGKKSIRKLNVDERLAIIANLFPTINKTKSKNKEGEIAYSEAESHFLTLTQKLYDLTDQRRYALIAHQLEYPLECISSYIQCITNSDNYLRRKYYDGQIRTKKDGTKFRRSFNISNASDLITEDDNGKQISPMEMVAANDKYFKNESLEKLSEDILSVLSNDEKNIAIYMCKKYTIKDISERTGLTKRQIETVKDKIKFKLLKWLKDNNFNNDYDEYLSCCKKYKDFEKKFENFLKKCEI